jgi:hypothetical protein
MIYKRGKCPAYLTRKAKPKCGKNLFEIATSQIAAVQI